MKIVVELDNEDISNISKGLINSITSFLESISKVNGELARFKAEQQLEAEKDDFTLASDFVKKHSKASELLVELGAAQQEKKHHKPGKNRKLSDME